MTVQLMHYAVLQGLQKADSYAQDNFLPQELDFFLNKMQDRFIKDRCFPDPQEGPARKFVSNQKRLDDVRTLLMTDYEEAFGEISETANGVCYLPADYLYLVNLRMLAVQTLPGAPLRESPCEVMENDGAYTQQANPFRRSTLAAPKALLAEDYVKIFGGKRFIVKGARLDYVRKPRPIDVTSNRNCELAEHTHHEIVDMTIQHLLEVTESPRYQSILAENRQSE